MKLFLRWMFFAEFRILLNTVRHEHVCGVSLERQGRSTLQFTRKNDMIRHSKVTRACFGGSRASGVSMMLGDIIKGLQHHRGGALVSNV